MGSTLTVRKNQDYIVEISDQTHEGMGVGKIDGFTVFIEGAIFGETVEVKIVKILKNYSYGKLLEVLIPSPYRVNPPCSVVKRCGGCQLQHMSYEGQLKYKTQLVKDAVERSFRMGFNESKNLVFMKENFLLRIYLILKKSRLYSGSAKSFCTD